jgi:ABC-type branched-subunit amino acid transport system permease subunit
MVDNSLIKFLVSILHIRLKHIWFSIKTLAIIEVVLIIPDKRITVKHRPVISCSGEGAGLVEQ